MAAPLARAAPELGPLAVRAGLSIMLTLSAVGGLPRHGTAPWTEPTLLVPDMQLSLAPGWAWLAAVELGLADGSVHARALRPAAPSGDARTWRTLVLLDLEAHPPRDAITRLTLRAEPTPARASQFSLLDPAQPTFSDVLQDNPFYTFVETAVEHGIISGYADGTFRPFNNVTRGQLAKIVVLARGWTLSNPGQPTFTDVPASDPFYGFVETAVEHGIISGYADNTYRPGNNATRGQISKIIYLAHNPA